MLPKFCIALQSLQQPRIRGRKFVLLELSGLDPRHGAAMNRSRFSAENRASEKFQVHRFFGVVMGDGVDEVADLDLEAEFLVQFAAKTFLETLARISFAAGKFPKAAQVRLRQSLGDEEFSLPKNQTGGNFNQHER
jgi:hypothetical protein